MTDEIIAMAIGLAGTFLFHLSKGIQKHNVEALASISLAIKNLDWNALREVNRDKLIKYIFGVSMNTALPVGVWIASAFAPPSYFTSMFGLGLIVLMLYSAHIIKEKIRYIEYWGAFFIVIGTFILGMESIQRSSTNMGDIHLNTLWISIGIYFLVVAFFILFAKKKSTPAVIGFGFGLITGACAALDPVFKSIGQNLGIQGQLLPSSLEGWVIFAFSFLAGILSFTITQLAFAIGGRASVLVPVHNSLMIGLPIVLQGLALPGFDLTWITGIGLFFTFIGITLIQWGMDEPINVSQ